VFEGSVVILYSLYSLRWSGDERNDVASAPESLWANSAYDASARKTLISLCLCRSNLFWNSQDILLWEEFCPVLRAAFESDEAEMLRFCIVGQPDDGLVKLSSWQNFVTWFSPLVKFDSSYQTKSSTTDSMGYNIKEIVDIVGQSWFFGFISAEEAKKILFSLPTGSFLFRFSSKAGQYALSVNYGQVGHWRIIAEKKAPGPPILVIDDHSYASFQSIVETHRVGGDSLVVKGSGITSCYLRFPVKREDYYKAPKTQYDRL